MTHSTSFRFPQDIELQTRPLVEAWLEIKWQLDTEELQGDTGQVQPFMKDRGYEFALGVFFNSIKDGFGFVETLPVNIAPLEFLPYVVRHRFRHGPEMWPILQLGPGVATVNFTTPYSWPEFRDAALYLRTKLIEAYGSQELHLQSIILRYRNAVPCGYSSQDLFDFLSSNLNMNMALPANIPGEIGATKLPKGADMTFIFDLMNPLGKGSLRLATGTKREQKSTTHEVVEVEHLIFDLIVASENTSEPHLYDESDFDRWLTAAHAVIHEWFFSLIDGSLRNKYEGKDS